MTLAATQYRRGCSQCHGSFAVMWEARGQRRAKETRRVTLHGRVPSPTASLYPPTSQNCDSERPGQAVLSLGASGQAKSRAFQRTQGNPELVLKPKMRHVTSMSELVPSCYSPLDGDIPPHMETVSMATYQHQFKVPFKLLQVNTNSSFLLLSVYYLNLNCSNYFSF